MSSYGGAPPNWYPDPADARRWRYWDGVQWTEHTAPMAGVPTTVPGAAAGADTGPSEALHWLVPVGRSGDSIAAGYLGLLCLLLAWIGVLPYAFVVILPLAGVTVWLAIRALKKARVGGHGSGRAIFGLVGAGLAVLGCTVGVYATFAASGS